MTERTRPTRFKPARSGARATTKKKVPFLVAVAESARHGCSSTTGIELIWIDLDEVLLGTVAGLRGRGRGTGRFKWRLLSLDDQAGVEMARVDVPFHERRAFVGRARRQFAQRGCAVLAIGINGRRDLAHLSDPDLDPFEPQSCTAYFGEHVTTPTENEERESQRECARPTLLWPGRIHGAAEARSHRALDTPSFATQRSTAIGTSCCARIG